MFLYSFAEGAKNIFNAKRISATAILVLFVSVFLICLISSLWAFTSYSIRYLDNQMQIILFVKKEVPETEIVNIQEELKNLTNVKKVDRLDQEEGKKATLATGNYTPEFINNTKTIKAEKVNFDRLVIFTKDSSKYKETLEQVQKTSANQNGFLDKIVDRSQLVLQLKNLEKIVLIAGVSAIVLFAIISTLVMANVFQIMIYSHRSEIEIQRLVGATNSYIRAPFVAQAIIYYFVVGFLVLVTLLPAINALLPEFKKFLGQDALSSELSKLIYASYFGILLFSVLLGIITTYLSINKYLKK
jgi:cell division transport system permease protein